MLILPHIKINQKILSLKKKKPCYGLLTIKLYPGLFHENTL